MKRNNKKGRPNHELASTACGGGCSRRSMQASEVEEDIPPVENEVKNEWRLS